MHITTEERRWVLIFAVIVMLATMLPYWMGFASEGDTQRFTGFVFGVEDGNSYIAKMLSGASGAWLFRTPYTAEPQHGVFMFFTYLLLGKLASPPGLHVQLVVLYHLFRFTAGILAILATYDFLAFFLAEVRLRRFGAALAILGGGLGWVLVLMGENFWLDSLPLDFYSPETFGFLGLYGVPHLALARALLLWALLAYLQVVRSGLGALSPLRVGGKITIFWVLAGLLQPLTTLVIGFVIILHLAGMLAWQLFRPSGFTVGAGLVPARGQPQGPAPTVPDWPRWCELVRVAAVAGIVPIVLVLYNAIAMLSDPFLQQWTAQNIIRSPHPLHYLVAYGLLLPLVVLGGRRLLRLDPWSGWLVVGWILALPLLAYMPVNLQRRLPEGEWVVWVLLAMLAVESWYAPRLRAGKRSGWAFAPFSLLFLSTLFLLVGGLLQVRFASLPLFRPADEVQLFEKLGAGAQPGAVVLSSYETGNALPAWAPLRVVIGHGPESANLAEIRPQVDEFFSAAGSDMQRAELIRRFDVRYVFWGPNERVLGNWDPSRAVFLRLLDQVGEYSLFEVVR